MVGTILIQTLLSLISLEGYGLGITDLSQSRVLILVNNINCGCTIIMTHSVKVTGGIDYYLSLILDW